MRGGSGDRWLGARLWLWLYHHQSSGRQVLALTQTRLTEPYLVLIVKLWVIVSINNSPSPAQPSPAQPSPVQPGPAGSCTARPACVAVMAGYDLARSRTAVSDGFNDTRQIISTNSEICSQIGNILVGHDILG